MKTKTTIVHDHPGRPRYDMKYPRSAEWTFTDLMAANGVCTDKDATKQVPSKRKNGKPKTVSLFGKGDHCTMLTLRKNLDHVMYELTAKGKVRKPKKLRDDSVVVPVEGVTADPASESGLGRRATLYRLRSVPAKNHVDKAPKVKEPTAAETIEAAKAILNEPASTIQIVPAPVVPAAPVAEVTAPVAVTEVSVPIAEPVAETPAPVVPAETAPVAA